MVALNNKNGRGTLQNSLTCLEGFLLFVYFLGFIFLISKITFKFDLLEVPRAFIVMLLVPLTPALLPFFIYSCGVALYYSLRKRYETSRARNFFKIHFIYCGFYIFFILYYIWKYVI